MNLFTKLDDVLARGAALLGEGLTELSTTMPGWGEKADDWVKTGMERTRDYLDDCLKNNNHEKTQRDAENNSTEQNSPTKEDEAASPGETVTENGMLLVVAEPDYDNMTVPELRTRVKTLGVTGYSTMKKDDLKQVLLLAHNQ